MQTPQVVQGEQLQRQFGETQLAQVKESGLALGLLGDALERHAVPVKRLHHAQYFGTAGCRR